MPVAADGTESQLDDYFTYWYSVHNTDVGKQLVVEVSWIEEGERKHIRSQVPPPGGIQTSSTVAFIAFAGNAQKALRTRENLSW